MQVLKELLNWIVKMWKNKQYGFIVKNVEFIGGWAIFINSGIEDFMDEEKFKEHFEVIQ